MAMDELPLAILSNILSRVPGESLLRHRRVCKRWREAIDDPYFRNSLHCSKERVVLYQEFDKEEIHLLKIHEEAATRMIEIEILRLSRAPDLSPDMSVYGLGFDGSTNTYKMVQIDAIGFDEKTRNSAMGARIYDFDKRSWRACKAPPPLSPGTGPYCEFVFASGALNWFLSSDGLLARAVLSFDLTKEEFSLIPIPDVFFEDGGGRDFLLWTQMCELGGSLALVHSPTETHTDVWVLRDPTRREWTRKYRIQPPFPAVGSDVVGAYSGDKLILLSPSWRDLYLYDVNEGRFTRCWTEADRFDTICRWETLSLVSLEATE
ncbi:putative F-box protein At1g67450 [Syzygium oleosum]|uniref:putative F-box protein At1g67450 n=1 Tax=Syzygium oleosum TaxID=219896 RepID=UPI0011D205CA|nr:putative F-box protein At1g67450 [Syzygium oleosum]